MNGVKGLDALQIGQLSQPVKSPLSGQSGSVKGAEGAVSASGNTPESAAAEFEGLLVQEMLKSMWQTVPQGQLLSGSSEEDMYRDMLNEAVASSISEGRGMGIREVILKDIKKFDKKA